jgi:hypothetical protein
MKELFAAVHESGIGPQRRFAALQPFGTDRGQTGHANVCSGQPSRRL